MNPARSSKTEIVILATALAVIALVAVYFLINGI